MDEKGAPDWKTPLEEARNPSFAWEDEKASGNFIIEKAKSLLENNTELTSDIFLNNQVRVIENLIARLLGFVFFVHSATGGTAISPLLYNRI